VFGRKHERRRKRRMKIGKRTKSRRKMKMRKGSTADSAVAHEAGEMRGNGAAGD